MNTMPKVMDPKTAEHFYAWLDRQWENEQHDIEQAVHKALREYPDLIERGLGWKEIARYGS